MKVFFLTNLPSPYRVLFFSELGKYCELTVAFERRQGKNRDKQWKAIGKNYKAIYLKGISVGEENALCLEIIKVLRKEKYDIIVVGDYSTYTSIIAIEFLKMEKIPFIISTDGGFISYEESNIKYTLKKHLISTASYWLSPSKKANDYLLYYGAKKSNIFIYPFTSLTENDLVAARQGGLFKKKECKETLNIHEKIMVLAVGQLIYRKGFDLLIKSAQYLKDGIGIYIVGGDPNEEYLKLIDSLHLNNVHFIEFMPKESLSIYYKAADIFVLPTREDIWGLVINEAMSYGLPIITTNKCLAGIELIENSVNGFIIPTNNVHILAESITYLAENDQLRKKIYENNINKIKNYSIEKMAKRHFNVFKTILSR